MKILRTAAALALMVYWTLHPSVPAFAADLYEPPQSHRVVTTINRNWTFNYLPAESADHAGCELPAFDDATWPAVALPHTWSTYETTGKLHPFIHDASEKTDSYWWYGWGWYRKHFSIGSDYADRKVYIEFDGVQKYCKVYLNGELIGDHKGGYTSFSFDLTSHIRPGADNVLAIAVNNRQNDPLHIPPMSAGNFDVYGGIYRDARLVLTDPLHIPFQGSDQHQGGTFVTTPNVTADSATVHVRTWVDNASAAAATCTLQSTVVDADGAIVQRVTTDKTIAAAELAEFAQTTPPLSHPHLWSSDSPYLYQMHSDVLLNGKVVDHFQSPLGIRHYTWDYEHDRLILNGHVFIIHGTNRHQEWPWLGDAAPKWLQLKDMADIRFGLNNNFMRTAHYPNDPCIYDFCDRNGIAVIEEFPNIKRQRFSLDVQVQQLREAIRRDRNHPSIFFWSMGNETDDAVDSKYAVEEDTTRLIHARDIYNDSAGKFVNTTSKQIALESLLRCTIRGWPNTDVKNLQPVSSQSTGTEEWQHDRSVAEIVRRNEGRSPEDRANINTWLYEDHGCDRQYINCPLDGVNPKGWVDCWRTPKYLYYLWQAFYADKPMVFIHPHFWQSQYLGQKKEIVVDSNCDTVDLQVNGHSIGTLRPRFDQANVVRFQDVLIQRGTLSAVTTKGGKTVIEEVPMPGPSARLVLVAEPSTVEAALDSVALLHTDIVDADGHHVYGATNSLQWSLTGPATLVGPPLYTSDINKNEAAGGTMYIDAPALNILRSSGKAGSITVRVSSPGLASAQITITATPAKSSQLAAILEPALPEAARRPVAREGSDHAPQLAVVPPPQELRRAVDDIPLKPDAQGYRQPIDQYLRDHNPTIDTETPEYQAVLATLTQLAIHAQGNLIRDDFNFIAGFYNNCRQITRSVEALVLPLPFKQSLHDYYARTIIVQGGIDDGQAELLRLQSVGPAKLVAITAGAVQPGVLSTTQTDLPSLVSLAEPDFRSLSPAAQQAALDAVCALNPNVHRTVARTGGKKADGVWQDRQTTITYEVTPRQPILIPSLDYLRSPKVAALQAAFNQR